MTVAGPDDVVEWLAELADLSPVHPTARPNGLGYCRHGWTREKAAVVLAAVGSGEAVAVALRRAGLTKETWRRWCANWPALGALWGEVRAMGDEARRDAEWQRRWGRWR